MSTNRKYLTLILSSVVIIVVVASGQSAPDASVRESQRGEVWIDPSTALMWATSDNGFNINWGHANKYCRGLKLGGYLDWRLPTVEELEGIYDGGASSETVVAGRAKGDISLMAITIGTAALFGMIERSRPVICGSLISGTGIGTASLVGITAVSGRSACAAPDKASTRHYVRLKYTLLAIKRDIASNPGMGWLLVVKTVTDSYLLHQENHCNFQQMDASMTTRSGVDQTRLASLEADFISLLPNVLTECSHGRWGVFGHNEHAEENRWLRWPEAEQLKAVAQEIQAIRQQFEQPNPIVDRFLEVCRRRGSNVPGEPKLALALLQEFGDRLSSK
jgi:hypothetical protein